MKENYNNISKERKQAFEKEFYSEKSFIQKRYKADNLNIAEKNHTTKLRDYFDRTIKKRLNVDFDCLENIHKNVSDELKTYDFDFGINGLTKVLYEMDDEFTSLYHDYIKNWVSKEIANGKKFWFQKTPTIRVHCPGANSKNVYPAYHNDTFLGHHPCELNIWIPFTYKKSEGHGFTLMNVGESKEILSQYNFDIPKYYEEVRKFDSKAFENANKKARPVTTEFGEILLFDIRSLHSTMPMYEQTRVSMDVRIIFDEDKESHPFAHQGLGRMKTPFEPGKYYYEKAVENSNFV